MSVHEKMTAIADAIRTKTGGTEVLTLDEMAEAIAGLDSGGFSAATGTVTIDAATESFEIDTGLSAVAGMIVSFDGAATEKGTWFWAHDSFVDVTGYVSTGTVTLRYAAAISSMTIDGGRVTVKQFSSGYLVPAGTYHWTACGQANG